jgi:WD40 repeat protein
MSELPSSPYKGLAAFGDSEVDALLFFGREREREGIVANLMASRLTVLYGSSGVGKSSLLRAGVAQRLRSLGDGAVVVHGTWAEDPESGLVASVYEEDPALGPTAGAVDAVAAAAQRCGEVYLLLDQFEEYFLHHGAGGPLADVLPELLRRPGLRVNVLIALRDDALAELDSFAVRVPGLFGNMLRLDRLNRTAAREAIIGPLERFGGLAGAVYSAEPELVDALLDEVAVGRVDLGDAAVRTSEESGVEAPFLQLVLERLWREERSAGHHVLRLETFRRLGGAEPILREHVLGTLDRLSADEQDAAARLVRQLITSSGAKTSYSATDLADYTSIESGQLERLLGDLGQERIVRVVEGIAGGPPRYEVFHDILAAPLLAWRARHELERERVAARRERRRLWMLVAAAFGALLIVAGVAIFALAQRSSARSQARRAHAHELAADALTNVSSDPASSVALALHAAQLSPEPETEDVLRTSLLAMRELHVLRLGGRIVAATFAPSGGRLLAASSNGTLGIYDTTGRPVSAFPHQRSLTHAVWSPDGHLVATGDGDGLVSLYRARDGHPLRRLDTGAPVALLAFSRAMLLAGSGDRLFLVDGARGSVRTLRLAGAVVAAALSPNHELVAVAAERGGRVTTRVLDANTGRIRSTLSEHGIDTLRFDDTGRLLVTGSTDKTARLWRVATGRLVHTLPQGGYVLASSFSPDGKMLVTASSDGSAPIWDVRNGVRLVLLVGADGSANDVAFSPDGKNVAVAFGDRAARVYDATDGRLLAPLSGDTDSVTSVGYDAAGDTLVTGSDDGTVRLWSANGGDQLAAVDRRNAPVRALFAGDALVSSGGREVRVLTPGGRHVATHLLPGAVDAVASQGTSVAASDTAGDLLQTTIGRTANLTRGLGVTSVAYAPDGTLITASRDGTIRLWSSAAHPRMLRGPGAPAAISATEGGFAVRGSSGAVDVYTPEGVLVRSIPAHAGLATLSPDGRVLATAQAREADLWSTSTGKLLHRLVGHRSLVTDVEFSPDGRTLVTASVDHDGRLWDTASGQLLHVLRGHFFPVRSASFSPNGLWVVTASQFSAGLWDASTGRLVLYLMGNTKPLTGAVFSGSDNWIATGSSDGTVRVVRCDICADLAGLERLAATRLRRIGATSAS